MATYLGYTSQVEILRAFWLQIVPDYTQLLCQIIYTLTILRNHTVNASQQQCQATNAQILQLCSSYLCQCHCYSCSTHYPHIHFTTNLSIYHLKMSQSLTRSETTQNSGHFFCDVLGAMDGTHINCNPSASKCQSAWNRKGGVTQNCLAVAALTFGFNIC